MTQMALVKTAVGAKNTCQMKRWMGLSKSRNNKRKKRNTWLLKSLKKSPTKANQFTSKPSKKSPSLHIMRTLAFNNPLKSFYISLRIRNCY